MISRVLLLLGLTSSVLLAQTTATKPATGKTDNSASSSSATSSSSKSDTSTKPSQKVDINSASKDDLDKLPGIGPAYSQKIIDGRPYSSKRDLLNRKILPQSTYDGVQDKIIAHHAKAAGGQGTKPASSTAKPQ